MLGTEERGYPKIRIDVHFLKEWVEVFTLNLISLSQIVF